MLRHPTDAPDDLSILYDYQLDNLDKLWGHDADMEYISVLDVTEIPRAPSRSAEADLIATHLCYELV